MKTLKYGFLFASLAMASLNLAACGDDDDDGDDDVPTIDAAPTIDADPNAPDADPNEPDAAPMDIEVNEDITTNTTWTYPNTYFLKKHVFVKNDATLTIEAGVIVKGDQGTSLVITRGAKIDAVGTAAKPIVFTSVQPEGQRAPGDWGGIVLLGKAKINDTAGELNIEGFPANTAEVLYGGQDDTWNCGTIKYARVEFPGFQLAPDKELNGISVGACGSQTTLEYIQVHKSSDDAVEFFGGTAGIKHAVFDQGLDDGLDWDFGWTGKVQFLVVQTGNGDGENGFEADNHPTNFTLTPIAHPTIYNATLIGPSNPTGKKKQGILFRRGTGAAIENIVITGYNGQAIDVRDQASITQFPATLFVKHSSFFGNLTPWDDTDATETPAWAEGEHFGEGAMSNDAAADPKLPAAAHDFVAPVFKPEAGSPLLDATKAATPDAAAGFDATAKFRGAIGEDDWTAGWTSFPQD